jgi:hypothetical protein
LAQSSREFAWVVGGWRLTPNMNLKPKNHLFLGLKALSHLGSILGFKDVNLELIDRIWARGEIAGMGFLSSFMFLNP